MNIAIIGGGISGLSMARLLQEDFNVKVFEKESQPGGLIKCKDTEQGLFHMCGGHVFNTHNKEVAEWFWSLFNREEEFINAKRHSTILMKEGSYIDYPIENHLYQFMDETIRKAVIEDLIEMAQGGGQKRCQFFRLLKNDFWKDALQPVFQAIQ